MNFSTVVYVHVDVYMNIYMHMRSASDDTVKLKLSG